jgi:hypothetical protein
VSDSNVKDPSARLDYVWDWTAWLAAGETITGQTVAVDSGDVAVDGTPTQTAGKVTAWLTGGTAGTTSLVTCHITTNAGRQDDRTRTVIVRNR